MYINKMIFMEYSELSKLPTAIYDHVVRSTDYNHSEILGEAYNMLLDGRLDFISVIYD